MKEDKLYDIEIIKPQTKDNRFQELYAYLERWSTQTIGYAWFLDSKKWNNCDIVPMKNILVIVKNKKGVIFRGYFDGDKYFITTGRTYTTISKDKVVWKYER